MAKRKTKKVKETVDLAPKLEKITDAELNKVQSTIRTMDSVTTEIGRLTVQKHGMLKGLENVQIELDNLRKEFRSKYGTDNINIQDGTIAPEQPPSENPNTPENGETDKED